MYINLRYQIITRCWQNDPDSRPTFTDLRNQLINTETPHRVRLVMKITPMTFLSSTREWKLSCKRSPNWQWFIQMSEDHPLNSNYRHDTGFFYIVSPMFHDRNCWNCLSGCYSPLSTLKEPHSKQAHQKLRMTTVYAGWIEKD